MAKKQQDTEPGLSPGERTAEDIHSVRRAGEAQEQAESGLDRHGKRANEDG